MRALWWDKQSCSHNVSQNKLNVSGAFLTKRKVLGRGVQTCVLEKKSLFEILSAARIGNLVGFAGPPGRHSSLNPCAALDFCIEIFGDRFLATFAVLTAEEHARKK